MKDRSGEWTGKASKGIQGGGKRIVVPDSPHHGLRLPTCREASLKRRWEASVLAPHSPPGALLAPYHPRCTSIWVTKRHADADVADPRLIRSHLGPPLHPPTAHAPLIPLHLLLPGLFPRSRRSRTDLPRAFPLVGASPGVLCQRTPHQGVRPAPRVVQVLDTGEDVSIVWRGGGIYGCGSEPIYCCWPVELPD